LGELAATGAAPPGRLLRTHRLRTRESQLTTVAGIGKTAGLALFLLTCLNLFNFIDRYVLPGVQPLVQKQFGVSDARIGTLTSAFFLTYMIAAPLTGWLGDHMPRKPLIVAGALLWSAATLLTATVHSYESLLFRHAVVGIGEATFSIFAPALLADYYPEIDRNRVLSIFYVAIPVGAALGYVTGGVLGSRFGWRAPFYVAAAPGVLLAIAFALFIREPERGSADRLRASPSRSTVFGLLHNPGYWTASLGMAFLVFSMGGISVWMPTFLVRYGGYPLSHANEVLGAVTIVDGILGTWVGGWIAQRWLRSNHRALYLLSAWSAVLAIPGALLAFFGPRSSLIPAVLVAEFFLFLNTGPLNAAIVNAVAAPIRSTAIAVNLLLIHALGDLPSPTVIGAISDRSGLRVGLSVTLISMIVSGVVLLIGSKFAPPLDESPL
jgi:MFS transporter, Spinster family, sphingosine-1-phosphate transporter